LGLTGTACPAGQRGSRKATDTLRRRDKRKKALQGRAAQTKEKSPAWAKKNKKKRKK
jgi:hypothetical protein